MTPGNEHGQNSREKKPEGSITSLLSLLDGVETIELDHFTLEVKDLELFIPTGNGQFHPLDQKKRELRKRPSALIPEIFSPYHEPCPGRISEVVLGATRKEGGSRAGSLTIGGSDAPPFTFSGKPLRHPPVLALDVFDMEVPLPRALKENVRDVMGDPAEWARINVEKFGADMVTVHLMSTDPLIRNSSPAEAARTVENVLQAVDVPLIIGGCGDPHKDAEVFTKVAEAASGERLLLNSVTLDMADAKTLEKVAGAAKKHNHAILGFTGLEINKAKELNRRLYEYLPRESIVMDLTTVALGYGLEYSFSIHERARHAALMGDIELQHPTISASTNAWAAREAWMQMEAKYGSKDMRGPIWETLNALTLLLAGVDLFMMMHPAAIRTMRDIAADLMKPGKAETGSVARWAEAKI
ncbi:MAG TPA: CO dehydrogenase/acetyl-CoA synthase subunit delta [Methanoregulaceae archaeon]|nr:CO dehydrogenase/acetyl-CoA synthase subunit delta [Methanoregulaceae archaeon]